MTYRSGSGPFLFSRLLLHPPVMRAGILTILTCLTAILTNAQTLGGNAVFSFLKLPGNPQLSALGGVNVSNISSDIGLAFNNPSLLRASMHSQLAVSFNNMYAGIKNYHGMIGYHLDKPQVTMAIGIHSLDYGILAQTDAAGNILGSFRPGDYVLQASASKRYLGHWYYGLSLKYIHSNYGLYRSNALAGDVGFSYSDTIRLFQAALVIKNMGFQLSHYDGISGEELPFDLQIGVTKRLANAPLQLSLTVHHLHRFDVLYDDTTFNGANGFGNKSNKTLENLLRHLVLAVQGYIGERIELTAAYNYLRRVELGIPSASNGMNGFSLGAGILFRKLQIRYARSYNQNNSAYNQFGLNLALHDYFGLGDFGQRVGW